MDLHSSQIRSLVIHWPRALLLGGALVLALGAAGCASGGGPARFPHYVEPIRQISLRGGRLGWQALVIGMSFRDAELALGERLPPLGRAPLDELCGYRSVEVVMRHQALRLEFDGSGDTGRLKAIWLRLTNPAGEASTLDLVRALKARFPDLVYVPSPHQPDLAESLNPRPLYRTANGALIFVSPRTGIYFGEICVD